MRIRLNVQFYQCSGNFRRVTVKCKSYKQERIMTNSRLISALAFLAALAGLSQTQPAAKPASTTRKAATPAAEARNRATTGHTAQSDAELEKEIRARFAKSKIAADKFEVHVQGGRATLTGSTNVLQHKGTATRLARTAGATDVVNKIEPSEEARQKASANLAKGRRRAQIKRSDARTDRD
jgi:osmotically-inducible protein OsmY